MPLIRSTARRHQLNPMKVGPSSQIREHANSISSTSPQARTRWRLAAANSSGAPRTMLAPFTCSYRVDVF